MKQCLILTYYRYPNGDAGSVRQAALSKLLVVEGYHVTVAGMGAPTDFQLVQAEPADYISFRHARANALGRVQNYAKFRGNLRRFVLGFQKIDLMLAVDLPPLALFWVKKYAKRNQIPLIFDSVEWYSAEEFRLGKLDVFYQINNLYNTRWIAPPSKVIAISTYLQTHFQARGLDAIRIPAVLDVQAMPCRKTAPTDTVVFLYAGSPGKKDWLAQITQAYAMLPQALLRTTQLRLVGVSAEQLCSVCSAAEETVRRLGERLQCLGRVPRHEVLRQLEQADFTVLLRPQKLRYAKAGFPTKVVESLASGTPVISNLTSDLSMYLRDMENGIVVTDDTVQAMAHAMERAARLSAEKRLQMQQLARSTAEECFDFRCYQSQLHSLIGREAANETMQHEKCK